MKIISETIKSSIAKVLVMNYSDVKIYKNKVEQGISLPCFFISQIDTEFEKKARNRFEINYLMNIRYHSNNATRTNLEEIALNLFDILETLNIEGSRPIYGRKLRYEVVDDILQFFVSYKLTVRRDLSTEIKMNELDLKGGIK